VRRWFPPDPVVGGTAMVQAPVRRIVLAYSGGLDTSVILRWLVERYQAEVVAFCADLGQGEELGGLEEKAHRTGAAKLVLEDLREEFVRDYVFPMLRAGAIYENQYLLGTSIARPLIAKRQVELARREGADAVAHGAARARARAAGGRRRRRRGRRPRRGQRRALVAGRPPRPAERHRRGPRRRAGGRGREPLCRHEVARRLRDAGRHGAARRLPGGRVAHARPRGHAPPRLARAALRRDGLLRLLVRARAADAAGRGRRGGACGL